MLEGVESGHRERKLGRRDPEMREAACVWTKDDVSGSALSNSDKIRRATLIHC